MSVVGITRRFGERTFDFGERQTLELQATLQDGRAEQNIRSNESASTRSGTLDVKRLTFHGRSTWCQTS